jgi:hypothetical protein
MREQVPVVLHAHAPDTGRDGATGHVAFGGNGRVEFVGDFAKVFFLSNEPETRVALCLT